MNSAYFLKINEKHSRFFPNQEPPDEKMHSKKEDFLALIELDTVFHPTKVLFVPRIHQLKRLAEVPLELKSWTKLVCKIVWSA